MADCCSPGKLILTNKFWNAENVDYSVVKIDKWAWIFRLQVGMPMAP